MINLLRYIEDKILTLLAEITAGADKVHPDSSPSRQLEDQVEEERLYAEGQVEAYLDIAERLGATDRESWMIELSYARKPGWNPEHSFLRGREANDGSRPDQA